MHPHFRDTTKACLWYAIKEKGRKIALYPCGGGNRTIACLQKNVDRQLFCDLLIALTVAAMSAAVAVVFSMVIAGNIGIIGELIRKQIFH